jgi:putative DNA primase/helicase
VLDEDAQIRGRQHMAGVYWCTSESNGDKTNPSQTWICSPLHIDALTHDAQGNNFGRLLRFKNSLGRWREWAMPMELLRADGAELRGELLAMGVGLDPYYARRMLPVYLQHTHPTRRVHCALQTGWCNGSYVLPDSVIGPDAADVIFQSGKRRHDEYTVSGTLDGWHDEIAVRAIGNPVLMLVVSTGFVGPLLARCHGESGGVHLVGDSSTGKTSAVLAACSVWGGKDYARSWRATANGMEGAAALYNDGLLALDEISECDPRDIGAIVYMLANGAGKQRAGRTGAARGVVRWRCVVLSSGERTIETSIHEGGGRIKAGQAVRMLDVPVRGRYGTWDDLHGAASGSAFSDALKRAAPLHHGHAGRAYLDRLTRDPRDFCAALDEIRSTWPDPPEHGQEKRALARFALIGLAGELATEYGLTGWPPGAAGEAARRGYEVWRSYRASGAGRTPDEHQRILQAVADFVERHGDSRFSDFDAPHPGKTIDRCGWWRDDPAEGRRYLFTSGGMREALTGYDFARGLDALQVAGALPDSPSRGERARPVRIDGRTVKVYSIDPSALDSRSTSLIGDVADVTGVTASSDAGSGVTSPGERGVTDVTGAGREGEGVTPVTSHVAPDVTENSYENSAVTPVTPKNNSVGGAQEDADEDAEYF